MALVTYKKQIFCLCEYIQRTHKQTLQNTDNNWPIARRIITMTNYRIFTINR